MSEVRHGQPLDRPQLHQLQGTPARLTSTTDVGHATSVALALARSLGLEATTADVLNAGANLSLRLSPVDVVARVVAEVGRWRAGDGFFDASRDVAVARAAAERGAPVIAPLDAPIGGPHRVDGSIVSFWRYVEVRTADHGFDDPVGTGGALRRLHAALLDATPSLDLPGLPVWQDVAGWLAVAPLLSGSDRAMLVDLHARTSHEIASLGLPAQALHGDAHPGNAIVTDHGVLWTDFEESGSWPIEWDIACLMTGLPFGRDSGAIHAMLEVYGRHPADPVLHPFLVARIVTAAAWMALTGDYRGRPVADRLAQSLGWLRERSDLGRQ